MRTWRRGKSRSGRQKRSKVQKYKVPGMAGWRPAVQDCGGGVTMVLEPRFSLEEQRYVH